MLASYQWLYQKQKTLYTMAYKYEKFRGGGISIESELSLHTLNGVPFATVLQ